MTTRTVRAGKTVTGGGTNAASDILTIQGGAAGGEGGAGGIVLITGSASNAGTIRIKGGATSPITTQAGGQGGLLDVLGVLTDQGSIVVGAGGYGSSPMAAGQGGQLVVSGTLSVEAAGSVTLQGGTVNGGFMIGAGGSPNGGVLTNLGVLDNAGLITMKGGNGFGVFAVGFGSELNNSGTLSNTGTIMVQGGGGGFESRSGQGANLVDSGVMTNAGLISLAGGYLSDGAGGGTLTVTGVLTNTGSIVLGGGAGGHSYYGPGYGGTLNDGGTVDNQGTIDIRGGGSYAFGAQFVDTGGLMNTGTITIGGSQATDYPGSSGGTLSVEGYLGSYGKLFIAGGEGAGPGSNPFLGAYYGGFGGVLIDSGTIELGRGRGLTVGGGKASRLAGYGGGSGGTLSIVSPGNLYNAGGGRAVVTIEGGAGAAVAGKEAAGQGGVFDVAGSFFQYDALILQAGGAGESGDASGGGGAMILSGALFPGSVTIEGGGAAGDAASASLTVTTTGMIDGFSNPASDIENGGRIVLDAGAFIGGSKLGNTGTISGAGTITSETIVNAGTIDAGTGKLLLKDDTITTGAAPGLLKVGLGGTLTIIGGNIDAGQSAILAGASATLAVTAGNAGLLVTSAMGGTLDITGGTPATLNVADTNLSVFLSSATNLTLSRMSAIAATGSSGADTITALAAGQILTGGLGADLLSGATVTGDIFRDIAAGLNGDTLAGFAGTDTIDITNIEAGQGLTLAYAQNGASGQLTVANGGVTSTFTLQGSFATSSFVTASDNHGGVQISLHG